MKKTLLSSMIIILMGLLGACSSNTSDKASLPEQSASENETATPVAIEVPDTLGKTYDAVEVMPEFIRGVTSELDQAALDIVSALPDWKPGEQDGQKVNVKYTLPVVFKLK